jgi:hypothetical protein
MVLLNGIQLTSALFKLAAGFAVATAAGVVSLALASVLGPMAVVRMSAGVMGLKFSSAFGLIGKAISSAGKSVIWLGRLMLANPILAVIGLIALVLFISGRIGTRLGQSSRPCGMPYVMPVRHGIGLRKGQRRMGGD